MVNLIIFVLVVFGGIYLLFSLLVVFAITRMSSAKLMPLEKEAGQGLAMFEEIAQAHQWAREHDFDFVGYYSVLNVIMAAWQRPDRPMFYWVYITQGVLSSDLVTLFDREISLTTGNSPNPSFFPYPPECYVQTFSDLAAETHWNRHLDAEEFLMDRGGARLVARELDFVKTFESFMRDKMDYVRRIPYWYLRGPYWFVIRRQKWFGKSIMQQHEQGMIDVERGIWDVERKGR